MQTERRANDYMVEYRTHNASESHIAARTPVRQVCKLELGTPYQQKVDDSTIRGKGLK